MTVTGQSRILTEDDGYYCDSHEPDRFCDVGKTMARIVSTVSPPSY